MNYLVIFSFTVLQTVPLIAIFFYVFREHYTIPPLQGILIFLLLQAVFVLMAGATVMEMERNVFSKLGASAFAVIVQWVLITWLTDLSKSQTLFIIFVMHSVVDDVQLSIQMIYMGNISAAQLLDWNYTGWVALFMALYLPFFYYLLKNELQPLVKVTRDYTLWHYMWLLPMFVFVMFRLRVCPDYFNQGFVWHPTLRVLPYVWTAGTLGVFYFVLKSLRMSNEKDRLERELETAELMSASHAKQYAALREQIESDRRKRHDFRHSLLLIQKYAQAGENEKVLEHIREYVNDVSDERITSICENVALDTVLRHFVNIAEKEKIKVSVCAQVPKTLGMTETELCVLVGNLVENALEACMRQKREESFIRIRIEKREKQMMSVSVSNPYRGEIRQAGGRYLSSKRNEAGIGLSSIAYIVEQHQGIMKVQHQGGVFTVNVLLNC